MTAFPDAIIVWTESALKHEEGEIGVHFCEFGARTLFRRFYVPIAIDVD